MINRKADILATITYMSILFLLSHGSLYSQRAEEIKQMANADSSRLQAIFKDLHQNPELGFMEVRTAAIVEKELKSLGYDVTAGIAKTGVAGVLRNGPGPVVMYRSDMDCNSVKETTGLPYASTKKMTKEDGTETPVMHGCGHDAHVTWMLGIAKIMIKLKNKWKGTLVFIAQPAEELLQGAQAMVNDGMYDKGIPVPDYLLGLHTWPTAVGTVLNGTGIRSAGSDQLDVTFHGIGAHGSAPERSKDAVVMASVAILQYQTIISRNVPPQEAAVLTVGAVHTGTDYNVIPSSVNVKLNLRWFSEKSRHILLNGIRSINEGLAMSNNLPKVLYPEINMKGHAFPLLNDSAMTKKINRSLSGIINAEKIITTGPPIMGSEDFSLLGALNKETKYDYLFVGIAKEEVVAKAVADGNPFPFYLHTGNYQVDLSAIPVGTAIGATALLATFTN